MVCPKAEVNRSNPGLPAAIACAARRSTGANRPIRADERAAADAAHPMARWSASGAASTVSASSSARCGLPAFMAKVLSSASMVVAERSRARVERRKAVARSGSSSIQN